MNVRFVLLLIVVSTGLMQFGSASAADEAPDELVAMVMKLIGDKDKDMRAAGLQQVREAAKGAVATSKFAAPGAEACADAQADLLDALGDRGDVAARPAALAALKDGHPAVRAAALRALGSFNDPADVPLIIERLALGDADEQLAATASLVHLNGEPANKAIAAELQKVAPAVGIKLVDILVTRHAKSATPALLIAAQGDHVELRMVAMTALSTLAGPDDVAQMIQGIFKAKPGAERDAAERAAAAASGAADDPSKRERPMLQAFAKLSPEKQLALYPALGRVGGPQVLHMVQKAIADSHPPLHDAGIRALCNWADSSVADRLLELAKSAKEPDERTRVLQAFIRVAALKDKRSDRERLDMLKLGMTLATTDDERNAVVRRCRAVRTVESLRYLVPYLERPAFAQEACGSIVELAHHKELREPNKREFDPASTRLFAFVAIRRLRTARSATKTGKPSRRFPLAVSAL